jgi:hypothetical protein
MPLHERDTVREQLDECAFVGHDMTREESGGFSHL